MSGAVLVASDMEQLLEEIQTKFSRREGRVPPGISASVDSKGF
jgi:hypothetical protein